MRIFAKTDCGKVRNINQDAFAVKILPDGAALAVVCDGMGGYNAGDIASKRSVDIISQYIINAYTGSMDAENLLNLIKNAISSANIDVYDLAVKDESLSGMGTTAVVAIVKPDIALICNVGDSRAYIFNSGVTQVTRDHSVVQSLVESGKLSPQEARVHPKKNVITRALGVEENVIPDGYKVSLCENDVVLLCTDGLTNYVDAEAVFYIIKNNEIDKIADILVDEANMRGGGDNITVVAVSH